MKRTAIIILITLLITLSAMGEGEAKITYGEDLVNGHVGLRHDLVSAGLAVTGLLDAKFATDHIRVDELFLGGYGELAVLDMQSILPRTNIQGAGYVGLEIMYTTRSNTNVAIIPYAGVEVNLSPKITWCTEYRYSKQDTDLPAEHLVSTGPRILF